MPSPKYAAYESAAPSFDLVYEVLYDVPGWLRVVQGRTDLMAQFSYCDNIELQSADKLTIGFAQSSTLKTGKSRTGETIWTLSRPGTH